MFALWNQLSIDVKYWKITSFASCIPFVGKKLTDLNSDVWSMFTFLFYDNIAEVIFIFKHNYISLLVSYVS